MCGVNKTLAKEIFSLLQEADEYKSYGYYTGKSFYGGEPVSELDARVKKAFDYIVGQKNDTVAVVTHSGVFRSFLNKLLNRTEKILDIADAGSMEIEYNNGAFKLIKMNGIKTDE